MLIVPNTENWNIGETDWSYVPDPANALQTWELNSGLCVPQDYRAFLSKYNGGSVYPRRFRHSISPETLPSISPEEYVDHFYRWDQVLELFNDQSYGRGIPQGYLNIGGTPGPLEILVSVGSKDYGQIFGWIRSSDQWGTGHNTTIYLLAHSFIQFLKMLYDDDARTDYSSWYIPAYKTVQRVLEL